MKTKNCLPTLALTAVALLTACGREDRPAPVTKPSVDDANAAVQTPARTPAPDGARVYFVTPQDGDVVPGTFTVEFGVEGMAVVRAGENIANSGHHHLLIDVELPDLRFPIPADANHVHYGNASTATELTLPPGEHSLQLLFADHLHIPHDPPVHSGRLTIAVQ